MSLKEISIVGRKIEVTQKENLKGLSIGEKLSYKFYDGIYQDVPLLFLEPRKEGDSPKYELCRFLDGKPGYPEMIELLSRHPNVLGEPKGLVIEPLPLGNDTSSMSAFYHFAIEHSKLTNWIRHADPVALVALKTKAYLNLIADKQSGKHVNSKDIRKHRSDILKNVVIIEDSSVEAPASITNCMKEAYFTESVISDFRRILFKGEMLTFTDFNKECERCSDFIHKAVNKSNAKHKIVVTHHVPSFRMQDPRFSNSKANGAFTVELEDYIKNSDIEYWIYGHSHYNKDVQIGNTKCISNQLGYVFDNEHLTFNPGKFIEV